MCRPGGPLALFNESLEGRFARLVGALHSMKGPNPVPQVAPEISHVIQISDDYERAAHHYLEGTNRYSSGTVAQTGDATHLAVAQFVNPATSGILAIVETCILDIQSNSSINIALFATNLAAGLTAVGMPLDTRLASATAALKLRLDGTTQIGSSGLIISRTYQGLTLTGSIEAIELRRLIIAPGGTLTWFSPLVNGQVSGRLIWRERAANPSELRTA